MRAKGRDVIGKATNQFRFLPGTQAQLIERPAIKCNAAPDAIGHRLPILHTPLIRRAAHRDEGEGLRGVHGHAPAFMKQS
jgi:hypothetical protein